MIDLPRANETRSGPRRGVRDVRAHNRLAYVLNVIEDPAERLETLVDAFHYARRLLVVAGLIKETVDISDTSSRILKQFVSPLHLRHGGVQNL